MGVEHVLDKIGHGIAEGAKGVAEGVAAGAVIAASEPPAEVVEVERPVPGPWDINRPAEMVIPEPRERVVVEAPRCGLKPSDPVPRFEHPGPFVPGKIARVIAIFAVLVCAGTLHAQIPKAGRMACVVRYNAANTAAFQAVGNMPEGAERNAMRHLAEAISVVTGWLEVEPDRLPADACGATIQRIEAQMLVWHERGWTPTVAEQEAADRAREEAALKSALQKLEAQ